MADRQSLGRRFRWLWTAYAISAYGSGFGFGAFPLIAIRVLHAGPAEVSALSAAGLAVGAVVAVPLGPWVEFRRKRPVMMTMDLVRFAVLLTIPLAYALGCLSFVQLMLVSIVVAAAKIAFNAASGAYLKTIVPKDQLLVANGRFESTTWSSITMAPPLGGAAIALFGPVVTVLGDAFSYLGSAIGIRAIGGREPAPERTGAPRLRPADLLEGWRHILASPALRPMLCNSICTGGLILATEPLLAILMLGQLGFPPWEYGLAFAAPCVGGLLGSRLARRLVARFGRHRVLLASGWARACWPVWLVFLRPGVGGLLLVIGVQFGLVTCMGMCNPVVATYRLDHTEQHLVARVLAAWSITSSATIAVLTALWGLLATLTSPRLGIFAAGALLLLTPLFLPRREHAPAHEPLAQSTGTR